MHKANLYAGTNMKYVHTNIKEFRIAYKLAMVWVNSKMDIKGVAHRVGIGYGMGQIQMDIVFLLFKRF